MEDPSSARTSAATLLSSEHGRMRRAQRLIEKRDLQAALRYGTRELSINPRGYTNWKYTWGDIVFITDETGTKEITSWAVPGAGLDVSKHVITKDMATAHREACKRLQHACSWTSHTVIIVDQSGSMRKTDVAGGATRSDAVWLTLAVDFVAKHIENGQSTATDVVSVVSMGREDTVLIDRQPHDWLLYNTIVDLLRGQAPHFEGNYLPALDAAERLMRANEFGACALTLFFLSDGKPSDRLPKGTRMHCGMAAALAELMGKRIDMLASCFGRRLSVLTVGFAGPDEDFSVLERLAERPKQFGSLGRFCSAQLNAEALGSAFCSITSSLNATRTELTALGGSSQRAVRDVRRVAKDTVGKDKRTNDNWYAYPLRSLASVSAWKPTGKDRGWFRVPPMTCETAGVALKKSYFGEGVERLVREFREIGPRGDFVGPLLVAKESRFQADVRNVSQTEIFKFYRAFCDTQTRAQGLATVFNEKLTQLPGFDPKLHPTVNFLECFVYMVEDLMLGTMGVLVEKQLDPVQYKKWNDNQGFVEGQMQLPEIKEPGAEPLGAIVESDEEEADDSEEDEGEEGEGPADKKDEPICVADIPQAFSHFTYRFTKRKLLVCDLQGVLSSADGFEFTDPVIHFYSKRGRRNVFGRTDRGKKGVNDFFKTHICGSLCRALNRRWVKRVAEKQRGSHLDGLDDQVSNLTI